MSKYVTTRSRRPAMASSRTSSSLKLPPLLLLFFLMAAIFGSTDARRHHLVLHSDMRRFLPISTFGYFPGGSLNITVTKFRFRPASIAVDSANEQFGLTLAQTRSNNYSPYLQEGPRTCLLNNDINQFPDSIGMIQFKFDFKQLKVHLSCNEQLKHLYIESPSRAIRAVLPAAALLPEEEPKIHDSQAPHKLEVPLPPHLPVQENPAVGAQPELPRAIVEGPKAKPEVAEQPKVIDPPKAPEVEQQPKAPEVDPNKKQQQPEEQPPPKGDNSEDDEPEAPAEAAAGAAPEPESVVEKSAPVNKEIKKKDTPKAAATGKENCVLDDIDLKKSGPSNDPEYSFQFKMTVAEPQIQGLYALYFHNCLNYPSKISQFGFTSIALDMFIEEQNLGNFLSAGEIPLPQLFFALSVIFFILGVIWFYSLQNRAHETFKIHYLMGVLVFVKAISLLFHGINYYFIAKDGTQVETWAVLYYVTHFLKGALLFIVIVLIGTGWAFIKHILSDKDKKIFMIVIPLQVIANIADIITEESEEGALIHTVWREIFILVDMICCGAILFPVIWSIRHLQEASQTDGKAAINLKKLQLFRHFYVMIVIYIYFTRIIVYLVKITVPFNYEWLDQLFQHIATLIFFVLTGYRFQPASSNPYYQLLQEEIEMDEEVLFIQPSTFSEAKKRNRDLESSDVQSLIGRGGGPNSFEYD